MSQGSQADEGWTQDDYNYLVETTGVARDLVERLVQLELGDLAPQAAYLLSQLTSTYLQVLQTQVDAVSADTAAA